MYLTDYHHHTDNSFDSKASMDKVCSEAIKKGINEICFTEHYAVNPNLPTYGHMDFQRYFNQIEQVRNKYGKHLVIKAGIELCEPHLMMDTYREVLQELELDFILGSVHNINEIKLRKFMSGKTPVEVYQSYFNEVFSLVSNADIDVIAHLDLMKRYAIEAKGNYDFNYFRKDLERILIKAIERGIGLEINTSGISNVKVNEAFPNIDVLKLYHSLGGQILTIGSDSHLAETVGAHLKDALSIAKEAGFEYIYTFEQRQPKRIKI
ncbi:histidinol-phosphatase HisJ family protein [Oceanobacillus jordanicus]|uniref:Histidinol-phosphatase n=1 Tax=Oceanobacillus jordanicus TaxID=2867266 RepID=A0AAW5B1N0_9BACI|nr:histidinol-phosphatase HisJ family protein [Oceanobacillus jordanicus]MCG3417630.1 histidinol-phosphatase HisJ family protein [Oceanobacillus jordanicus]